MKRGARNLFAKTTTQQTTNHVAILTRVPVLTGGAVEIRMIHEDMNGEHAKGSGGGWGRSG